MKCPECGYKFDYRGDSTYNGEIDFFPRCGSVVDDPTLAKVHDGKETRSLLIKSAGLIRRHKLTDAMFVIAVIGVCSVITGG